VGRGSYVVKRIIWAVPVIFGVTVLTFVVSHVITPNPVLAWGGERSSPAVLAAVAERYHLRDPLYIQYVYYMADLLRGDWGFSPVANLPVAQELLSFFPATIELSLGAIVISVIVGILVGVLSALWYRRKLDYPLRFLYLSSLGSPPFLVALVLQLLFAYYFRLLPSGGELSPGLSPPQYITGMVVVDSLLTGNWIDLWNSLWHLILPATALALLTFPIISRITRSSMLEVMDTDFVRTAKAKGVPRMTVTLKHTLRNALISTVSVVGIAIQMLLSGTIVIESIFFWPGIGLYTTRSILSLDFPSIMGITVVFALIVIVTNLATDLAYGVLDPRITYQ
jgi:peptide/nickel transport system permease protein